MAFVSNQLNYEARDVYSTTKILNDVNIESWLEWENSIKLVILCPELHIAIDEDESDKPTDGSSPEEKAKYEKWERSNRLCLMIMRSKICSNIYSSVCLLGKSRNAKQMLAALEEMFMKEEKMKAPSTLKKLSSMRYDDGQDDGRSHLKMSGLASRLRNVDVRIPDYLINRLLLDSLPLRYDTVRIQYLVQGEKWGVW